jgi:prepilin-type N-terminal cleavage/methylation domain-containing protein
VKKGLTLVEILVVVGVLAIIFTLGTVVYGSFAQKDQVLSASREVENLINEARTKTIAGFTAGDDQARNFGVYFQSDRYYLFPGTVFDPNNQGNQEFLLPLSIEIKNVNLPGSSVIFEKVSGEVRNYDPVNNWLILASKRSEEEKKLTVNRLGVVVIENF